MEEKLVPLLVYGILFLGVLRIFHKYFEAPI
jgi:hypothetical protein